MNIFALDRHPGYAAMYHCDKHIVKMATEYAQILSTVVRIKRGYSGVLAWDKKDEEFGLNPSRGEKWRKYPFTLHGETSQYPSIYLVTHVSHPSVKWALKSFDNFHWLLKLAYHVNSEFTLRYGKVHKALAVIKKCEPNYQFDKLGLEKPITEKDFPLRGLTKPPQVMPENIQIFSDVTKNYRLYYASYKFDFATWKKGEPPDWFLEYHKIAKKKGFYPPKKS